MHILYRAIPYGHNRDIMATQTIQLEIERAACLWLKNELTRGTMPMPTSSATSRHYRTPGASLISILTGSIGFFLSAAIGHGPDVEKAHHGWSCSSRQLSFLGEKSSNAVDTRSTACDETG